jgi:hypothetical protein
MKSYYKNLKQFKSGDIAPVSGNYRFLEHAKEVKDCVPRWGAYIHLLKGMKIPLHDDCQEPGIYGLMTVTEENLEPMLKR